ALPRAAQPEVPVVEQKVDAMLFWLDRVVERARANDGERRHAHLVAAGRARLGAHLAGHGDRCLERELLESFPDLRGELRLDEHRLHHAGTVADCPTCSESSAMRGVVSAMWCRLSCWCGEP